MHDALIRIRLAYDCVENSRRPSYPCTSGAELETHHHSEFCEVLWGEARLRCKRTITGTEAHMRSELVYMAGLKIENRFLLASTVMRAVQKLHINSRRTEDTLNRIFADVAESRYTHGMLPKIIPPPFVDALVVSPIR